MALITLAEYRTFTGIDPTDTRADDQITSLLAPASGIAETFAGRDFDAGSTPSARSYIYDGSGVLDIDDCRAVTQVTLTYPNSTPYTLTDDEYNVMPSGAPVAWYLTLNTARSEQSPLMGFTRNLDTMPLYAGFKQPTVTVTATWGWPAVPDDVKLAVALIVQEMFTALSHSEGLTSEAIEGYSRSWNQKGANSFTPSSAIPARARDILAAYQRFA